MKKAKENSSAHVFGCDNSAELDQNLPIFYNFPKRKKHFIKIINKFGSYDKVDRLFARKKLQISYKSE